MDERNPPVVVICGSTAGVGRATAHRFAVAGYRVGLLARGEQALAATAEELDQLGATCLGISVDVADAEALFDAAQRMERELGPVGVGSTARWSRCFRPSAS